MNNSKIQLVDKFRVSIKKVVTENDPFGWMFWLYLVLSMVYCGLNDAVSKAVPGLGHSIETTTGTWVSYLAIQAVFFILCWMFIMLNFKFSGYKGERLKLISWNSLLVISVLGTIFGVFLYLPFCGLVFFIDSTSGVINFLHSPMVLLSGIIISFLIYLFV